MVENLKKKNELEMDAFVEILALAGLVDGSENSSLTNLEIRQSFVDAQDDGVMGDDKSANYFEFREALLRCANEKWEGEESVEGRQSIAVKFKWVVLALMHLHEACRRGEGKEKLAYVVTSRLIENNNLILTRDAFIPLVIGMNLEEEEVKEEVKEEGKEGKEGKDGEAA